MIVLNKKAIKLFSLISDRNTTYSELIEFLYGESPPSGHNFLKKVDDSLIAEKKYSRYFESGDTKEKLPFSVVIPTFNRGGSLKNTISSVLSQQGIRASEYEIIIVDDGSSDNTSETVEGYLDSTENPPISYIRLKKNSGPAVARNIGIKLARGELICFTDDDCIVPNDWIFNFRNSFIENPEVAGVGGWFNTLKIESPLVYKYLYGSLPPSFSQENKTADFNNHYNKCGNTANICYRKSALQKTGGFNHYFRFASLEDWELKIRMHKNGFFLLYKPSMATHLRPATLENLFKGAMLRGWARLLIRLIHPDYNYYFFTDRDGFTSDSKRAAKDAWRYKHQNLSTEDSALFVLLSILRMAYFEIGKYRTALKILSEN